MSSSSPRVSVVGVVCVGECAVSMHSRWTPQQDQRTIELKQASDGDTACVQSGCCVRVRACVRWEGAQGWHDGCMGELGWVGSTAALACVHTVVWGKERRETRIWW